MSLETYFRMPSLCESGFCKKERDARTKFSLKVPSPLFLPHLLVCVSPGSALVAVFLKSERWGKRRKLARRRFGQGRDK